MPGITGLVDGPLTEPFTGAVLPYGTPPGPTGLGGNTTLATPGTGWEICVRSYADFTTLLCQVPPKLWTTFQFVKMLNDTGSGSITLNMDDPFWATGTLGDGSSPQTLLNCECLWQVIQNGMTRFEFLGETVTEQLIDPSEARLVTITGPGGVATLKWAMAAPEGFPDIVNKLDGLVDAFDEVDSNGNPVLDANIWETVVPPGSVYVTPVTNAYLYPGGAAYQLDSLYPTGTLTIEATSGPTLLGSSPWDATDTLVSLQVTPTGSHGAATDSNGYALVYGTGLDGSQVTQVYIESLADSNNVAGFGLTSTDFYCWLSGDSGTQTKIISAAQAFDFTNDAYWMITEQGGSSGGPGTFFFYTSSDGASWTLQWQVVHSWDATKCGFYITAGYDAAGQVAIIQSLNANVQTPSYQGNLYLNEPMMGIWSELLTLAQARGTIPFVTTAFSAAADTYGNAWTDTNNVQVTNGTDLFTLLQSCTAVCNADFVMQPGFNLQVGQRVSLAGAGIGLGTDRSQQVIFRESADELAKQRVRTRNAIANLLGAENQDGTEVSASVPSSIAQWGQREGWYQTSAQVDPVSMVSAAEAMAELSSAQVLSWTLSILPGEAGRIVFQNFDVGDWVGLEEPGITPLGGPPDPVDAVRVTGIAVQVDANGVETNELTLVSYLQFIEQQLTYLAGKLGGAFVNVQGTTAVAPGNEYGIGQVPTYFSPAAALATLSDVIGTSSAPNGAPLVYNATTGMWQPATATVPTTGLPVGVTIPGPTGTVVIGSGGVAVTGQPAAGTPDGGVISVAVPSITTTPSGTVVVDPTGLTRVTIGEQADGTFTVTNANGGAPATPDTPTVVNGPSSLGVAWDGLLAGGAPLMDFLWTEVHVSTANGFTPSAATLHGTLQRGGGILAVSGLVAGTTYYVVLLARNTSLVTSAASAQVAGVPIAGGPQVTIGSVAPSSPAVNDLWFNASNNYVLEQWNGTAWVPYQFGTGAIATGSITAAQIAANTITAAQIAAGQITTTQLAANTITAGDIAAGTITAGQIAAGTITASLLAAGIVVAGIVDATTITGASLVADGSAGDILIYSGAPATGNLIGSWSGASGTDAHSNSFPAGLNFTEGSLTGPNFILNQAGAFFYSGAPGSGNLVASIAGAAGSDAFGNSYPAGIFSQDNSSGNNAQLANGTVYSSGTLNMDAGTVQYSGGVDETSGNFTVLGNLGVNGGTVWWPGSVGIDTACATVLAGLTAGGGMGIPTNYPLSHIGTAPTAAEFNAMEDTLNNLIAEMINRNLIS